MAKLACTRALPHLRVNAWWMRSFISPSSSSLMSEACNSAPTPSRKPCGQGSISSSTNQTLLALPEGPKGSCQQGVA